MTLSELVRTALSEDMPRGDITTDNLLSEPKLGRARLVAKEDLVLSGSQAFTETLKALDSKAELTWHFKDGDFVLSTQNVCSIQGDLAKVLSAERTALNFLGHLSGVATFTKCFTKRIEGTKSKVLDTRKTTPCFRELEKQAVLDGQGTNHRLNLSDGIMLKDNHLSMMGGMRAAVARIRTKTGEKITVEADTLELVKEAIDLKVNRILLDNMSLETIEKSLALIPPSIETEVSGNISMENILEVAQLGVNFISVGAITHSAPAADFSLKFDWDDAK